MSQQSLTDLLGDIKEKYADRIDAVSEGRAPANAWDGPPMPLTNEYRVRVDTSVAQPSKAGNLQFVVTYEIQEPVEFEGRKVQAYVNPKPTNEAGSRSLADFFGAMRANLEGWGDDWDGFAAQFVGATAVITLNTWGDENDRYGVRWINADRGQTLKTDVKPQAAKKAGAGTNLKADIQIPKNDAPSQAPSTSVSPPEADEKPAVTPPTGGPNLPPGLRS